MVELASLHSPEAKGVPAQRRVRHELRLELADGDRHLPTAETATIDRSAAPTKVACRDLLFSAGRRGGRITAINIDIIIISITYYYIDITSIIVTSLQQLSLLVPVFYHYLLL